MASQREDGVIDTLLTLTSTHSVAIPLYVFVTAAILLCYFVLSRYGVPPRGGSPPACGLEAEGFRDKGCRGWAVGGFDADREAAGATVGLKSAVPAGLACVVSPVRER